MNRRFVVAILGFALATVATWWYWQPQNANELTVVMLNIGQGDAIYMRTPNGMDILIDGGPDRSILYELGAAMPAFDRQIELVIATHPDSDHIAGLMEATDRYGIAQLITNGRGKDTHVAQQFFEWIEEWHIPHMSVHRGDRLDIEPGIWIEFLHPTTETHEDTNDDSIVAILHHGEVDLLFTGDAASVIEEELITAYSTEALDVEMLKVGHHGSKFSTSSEWLRITTPDIALISAGKQNAYHHPHPSVQYRLRAAGAEILRTDQHGRVTCQSDGKTVTCAPQHE